MKASRLLAAIAMIPIMIGSTHIAAAGPVPLSLNKFELLKSSQNAKLKTVHCRRFVHVHRRCTLWRGGVCRRWVSYRHRCG